MDSAVVSVTPERVYHPRGFMFLMLVEGIGLSLIAACTILEGIELWFLEYHKETELNRDSLVFWFSGRTSSTLGLIFLCFHTAALQRYHKLEIYGMSLLTLGPCLNVISAFLYHYNGSHSFSFPRHWVYGELTELVGMILLDISCIEMEGHFLFLLVVEVMGYFIVGCASIFDFNFEQSLDMDLLYGINIWSYIPSITLKIEPIPVTDCFGLFLLTFVAFALYDQAINPTQSSHHRAHSLKTPRSPSPLQLTQHHPQMPSPCKSSLASVMNVNSNRSAEKSIPIKPSLDNSDDKHEGSASPKKVNTVFLRRSSKVGLKCSSSEEGFSMNSISKSNECEESAIDQSTEQEHEILPSFFDRNVCDAIPEKARKDKLLPRSDSTSGLSTIGTNAKEATWVDASCGRAESPENARYVHIARNSDRNSDRNRHDRYGGIHGDRDSDREMSNYSPDMPTGTGDDIAITHWQQEKDK